MSIMPDHEIEKRSTSTIYTDHNMIVPFAKGQRRPGLLSYGSSSYGYDVRVGFLFKVFSPIHATEIDPKAFNSNLLEEIDLNCSLCNREGHYTHNGEGENKTIRFCTCAKEKEYCRIPPHSFALCESYETFNIPRDVLVICLGKSTYARCGVILNVTPLEPEWKGKITIELSNTTPLPVRVYPGEGIAQLIFLKANNSDVCKTSYADKQGIYQNQTGLTIPKVRPD